MERISAYPKNNSIPILIEIAISFAYKDEGLKDAFYAEKVFKKIEDLGKEEVFNEGLIYLRAFNLEKIKEYGQAKNTYINLVRRFPGSAYADEADFKTAIIYTYILRDIKNGKSYFEELSKKETPSPQAIASLYQLGLLSQWEENPASEKEYYNKLIERAKDSSVETVTQAKERIKEIEENKPIDYNLKMFLDLSLKEENMIYDMTRLDLKASLYTSRSGQDLTISSYPSMPQAGCMQVEAQYLWSADLGKITPSLSQSSFSTSFTDPGTKVINLVVVLSSGALDRDITFIDVR
jgi:hypothetical protein